MREGQPLGYICEESQYKYIYNKQIIIPQIFTTDHY